MNTITQALTWRYATKKFDPTKKINLDDMQAIREVLRLTPSSFGLQPWKFVFVKNPTIRETLVEHSWGQRQVADASDLLILCRVNSLREELVENYISDIIETTGANQEQLEGYKNMMLGFVSNMPKDALEIWAEKQVYIALWNVMTALASMEIDACPMEWFSKEKFDEILGLTEKGLSSVLVLPIGYRALDDDHALKAKVRFESSELFLEI